jgi:23S rRNA (cytosine1962-C5)-methyltransferase
VRRGHPWLFAEGITEQSHQGQPGDLAVAFDGRRRFLAIGLFDPDGPIRVRWLQHAQPATINQAWLSQRLTAALALRQPLASSVTTGYRLVHGENDGLPGLVVDRYDSTLVVRLDTAAWAPHFPDLLPAILAQQPAERVALRLSRLIQPVAAERFGLSDGHWLAGATQDGRALFVENGLIFEADVLRGQKTGFFLDQRENRAAVEAMAAGRRTLNVFAYSGGFSLYAARGGAPVVDSLDASRPALAAARRNFGLNAHVPAVRAAEHNVFEGDAFNLLPALAAEGRRYDLVIVDPPSLARREAEIEGALVAYGRLAASAVALLEAGGLLVMASCSSRVAAPAFFATVRRAAREAGRPLTELARTGHPLDHPVGFAEGAYLKCLFARVA